MSRIVAIKLTQRSARRWEIIAHRECGGHDARAFNSFAGSDRDRPRKEPRESY